MMGECRIITALNERVLPISHIQSVVGIFSVRVPSNVLDLSNIRRLVPVLVSVLEVVGEVGGHIDCVAFTKSRSYPPFWDGTICSCHIYRC